jgi:hypothetical protein
VLKSLTLSVALLAVGCLLAACSAPSTNTTTNTVANTTANIANSTANAAGKAANTVANTTSGATTGSQSDPKSAIAYQFDLVKAGDVEKLKAALTPRVRDGVTKEVVDKAKVDAAQYTIDDLYASAEMGTAADGKKTAKVKMKNGRTLTTLIETDGKWLADTIWFK